MYVKDLLKILVRCNPDDEVTFIFDDDTVRYWDRGDNLKEVTMFDVTGHKINGKIAFTNGRSAKLLKGDEPTIFKSEDGGDNSTTSSENLESELETLTAQYDATIEELNRLDDETDLDTICTDKELMAEYESKKTEIENRLFEIADKIDKVQDQMEKEFITNKK